PAGRSVRWPELPRVRGPEYRSRRSRVPPRSRDPPLADDFLPIARRSREHDVGDDREHPDRQEHPRRPRRRVRGGEESPPAEARTAVHAAATPNAVPAPSTRFPNQTGNRSFTRASNALRSMSPAASAHRSESPRSAFTRFSNLQNPKRERSVSPASIDPRIR